MTLPALPAPELVSWQALELVQAGRGVSMHTHYRETITFYFHMADRVVFFCVPTYVDRASLTKPPTAGIP